MSVWRTEDETDDVDCRESVSWMHDSESGLFRANGRTRYDCNSLCNMLFYDSFYGAVELLVTLWCTLMTGDSSSEYSDAVCALR